MFEPVLLEGFLDEMVKIGHLTEMEKEAFFRELMQRGRKWVAGAALAGTLASGGTALARPGAQAAVTAAKATRPAVTQVVQQTAKKPSQQMAEMFADHLKNTGQMNKFHMWDEGMKQDAMKQFAAANKHRLQRPAPVQATKPAPAPQRSMTQMDPQSAEYHQAKLRLFHGGQ